MAEVVSTETEFDVPVQPIQRAATMADIVKDHNLGLSGYAIAAKYGLDTEVVKRLINEANEKLMFVPKGKEAPVDALGEPLIQPLAEGEEPSAKSPRGHK